MISNPIIISASIHILFILIALVGLPSFQSPGYDIPLSMNVEMINLNEIIIQEVKGEEKEIEKKSTKKYSSSSYQEPLMKQENLIISKPDKLSKEKDAIEDISIKKDEIKINLPKKKPQMLKVEEEILTNLNDSLEKKKKVDKVTALLDKFPDDKEVNENIVPKNEIEIPVRNASMTGSETRNMIRQLSACWNPPRGVREANNLSVKIQLRLNRDGTLIDAIPLSRAKDRVGLKDIAVESAIRGVRKCAPYDFPTEKFELWKEMVITFDPKNMLGG
ncbi:MAG: cell envelope integrity protein TolA [Rhodobiaceae bacterium]|jgi:hypothetical protein|nr:cell envelope integrity protein TolA [Rhodobiaceae bacterium]MDC3272284.1 hypothetical protein [Hyphomicrobiales bacterium]|tara:strand:- start:584 stop:1411 length:828 start_codon:yes stop_codon:yes gene_type:complete